MADLTKNIANRDDIKVLTLDTASASQTLVFDSEDERTFLFAVNSHATQSATITIAAGTGMRSSIGDKEVTLAAGKSAIIGPFDSMRFKNLSTGKVKIDVSGGSVELAHIVL